MLYDLCRQKIISSKQVQLKKNEAKTNISFTYKQFSKLLLRLSVLFYFIISP